MATEQNNNQNFSFSCTEVQRQVYERIEMEYIMSWLSTLGGAFSSLGDQFVHCVSCLLHTFIENV